MVSKIEKVFMSYGFDDVRAAFISRARFEAGRLGTIREWMSGHGFERVEVPDSWHMTDDGREIFRAGKDAWALLPAIHAERVSAAIEAVRQASEGPLPEPDTKSVVGTESLSQLVCPKCGDALQHASVCPACAAGKIGYRHRYTCVCGGVDLVSKEPL